MSAIGGVLLAIFQLIGRSEVERFIGAGGTGWFLELRLWVLGFLTLWLIGVGAVSGTRRFDTHGVGKFDGMVALFLWYMIATAVWAPYPIAAAAKAYDLLFVVWACVLMVAALRITGVHATIAGFWGGLFIATLAIAAIGVVASVVGPGGRLSVLGGGPNVFGRNMGLLALASLCLIFDGRRARRIIGMVAAPVATLLVLLSGSRGAMLSLFFGVVIYLFVHRVDRRVFRSLLAVSIVGAIAVATQFGELAVAVFRDRFVVGLLVEQYFTHRDVLLLEAVRAGMRNPLGGLGLSGFEQVGTRGAYPHNIFAEALAEGGILGLILLCMPLLRYIGRWRRGMGPGNSLTVAGLGLLGLSSSISGDLFDARGVFLLLLMAVASQRSGGPAGRSVVAPRPQDER